MHSDREKLVERLHHAITTASNDDMSRPGTHMRERHTARLAAIEDAIAALSEPVKDEPVAQWRVGEWGDGSTKPGEAVIFCDAHEAAVAAGVPSHLAKMIVEAHNDTVTRPAGERPAVAVEATGDEKRCRWPDCDCYSPQGPHACRRALEQKP